MRYMIELSKRTFHNYFLKKNIKLTFSITTYIKDILKELFI